MHSIYIKNKVLIRKLLCIWALVSFERCGLLNSSELKLHLKWFSRFQLWTHNLLLKWIPGSLIIAIRLLLFWITTRELIPCFIQLGNFPYSKYMIVPIHKPVILPSICILEMWLFIWSLIHVRINRELCSHCYVNWLRMNTVVFQLDCLFNSIFSNEYIKVLHYWIFVRGAHQ